MTASASLTYTDYWSLKQAPFENTPDPKFLYESPQHQEGLARLTYVVEGRKGAGLLTGVFGCGKTLLARALLKHVPAARYRTVYLSMPLMSELDLLHGIAVKLGVPNLPDRRSDVLMDVLIEAIGRTLLENARDGKDTLVIVDEAHVIRDEQVFEALRLLLNFQTEDRFLLTLILMGQPELKEMIDRHKPLAQRICLGHHLVPLTAEETRAYVGHRLTVAGAAPHPASLGVGDLFSEDALRLLHEFSGGIPRRINQLADLALVSGMGLRIRQIDESIMQDTGASLGV